MEPNNLKKISLHKKECSMGNNVKPNPWPHSDSVTEVKEKLKSLKITLRTLQIFSKKKSL